MTNLWRGLRYKLLRHFARIAPPGRAIEVGVYNGATLRVLRRERDTVGYDSRGLFDTGEHDNHHSDGEFASTRTFDDVHYGRFQKTFEPRPLSFVHIDVDTYESTADVLTLVYPCLVYGGIIVCDDYGAPTCRGARKAVDESGLPGVELPTYQWVFCNKFAGLVQGGGDDE